MAVRPIVMFPDPRLRAVAAPVTAFDDALRQLAADLLDTMRAAPGVGLTAPHIGVLARLVVLELPGTAGPRTYVNPELVHVSDERIVHREGSVAMPGVVEEVERAARVTLRYRDLTGAEQTEDAEGFAAVCHQHEIDQLDGIFWIQRLSRLKRERLVKRYDKLRARL
jgi:peptide deformylase